LTLESVGVLNDPASMLSNDMTAMSRGMAKPASVNARMSPIAVRSVATMRALGGGDAASTAWAARAPPFSELSGAVNTSVGSVPKPWALSAPR
jgi:hypothetical protein